MAQLRWRHQPTPTRRRWLLSALGLSAAIACAEPEVIVEEGERIDIHYADEFQLCGGTVESFDRGLNFVAEQLALDPTSFKHMTYTWLGREEYIGESSGYAKDQGGWAYGDESYAQQPDIFHEVVHMISHQEKINAITFLTEGLATAFEDHGSLYYWRAGAFHFREDPRPYLGERYPDMNYGVAGNFVSYMLARFGPELYWEFNRELRFLSTAGKFRRRFAKVYGIELDEVVEDYLGDESCTEDMRPIPMPPSCIAPEVPWLSDDLWGYARVMQCEDEDVVGGWGDHTDKASVAVTLRVERAGVYDLRVFSDHEVRGLLRRCGPCPWIEPSYDVGGDYLSLALDPGVYSLVIHARASDSPPVVAALTRLPEGTIPTLF